MSSRSKTSIVPNAYHEAAVDFASTNAEATSAGVQVLLPKNFVLGRPIECRLLPGQTAMNDNAILLEPAYDLSSGQVRCTLKFANNNVAAGAAIDPGSKIFYWIQW